MPGVLARLLCVAAIAMLAMPAMAQQSNEDRLREALKRQIGDLRAAQDVQAGLQAQIADLTKQRDSLQLLLEQARAQTPPPPAPAVDPVEMEKLRHELDAAHAENTALQAALAKWQAAYKEAASLAQAKNAEAKRLDATLKVTTQTLDSCKQANVKLISTAHDILHLYETREFRALVSNSYEPLLGLKRVDLENLVQDYEDRIYDARFQPTGRVPGPPTGAKPAP